MVVLLYDFLFLWFGSPLEKCHTIWFRLKGSQMQRSR
jgi:hypothetical protein